MKIPTPEIDQWTLHKLGFLEKPVKWFWFMRNGEYASSSWNWKRLFCLFDVHDYGDKYHFELNEEFGKIDLEITLACNRCHHRKNFVAFYDDMFYKLIKYVSGTRLSDSKKEEIIQKLK